MADYGLDKGFLWEGTAAQAAFFCVKLGVGGAWTANLTSAITDRAVGVLQEPLDATKAATGRAVVDVRMAGVTRCVAGAAASGVIAAGAQVAPDALGKVQVAASTQKPIGIALTATSAANQQLDVQLTPGLPAI